MFIFFCLTTVSNRTTREQHLNSMLAEAERCVHDLSIQSRQSANGSSSLSSAWLKEKEKQLVAWERRLRLVQRLKKGLEQLGKLTFLQHIF